MIEMDDETKQEAYDSLAEALMNHCDMVLGIQPQMLLPIPSDKDRILALEAEISNLKSQLAYLEGYRDAMRGT